MSRTERLLELMQILRRHRYPVAGHALAQEMNISMRTLYRREPRLLGRRAWDMYCGRGLCCRR